MLAKNFGVDPSVFDATPRPNPGILNATLGTDRDRNVTGAGQSVKDGSASSFVYRTLRFPAENVPGGGGVVHKIDSTNFPISTTIAASFVRLKPGGLRELHWHPNVSIYICISPTYELGLKCPHLPPPFPPPRNKRNGF